ncbi:hypothetical protein ABK040_000987 [Willaertia magna]
MTENVARTPSTPSEDDIGRDEVLTRSPSATRKIFQETNLEDYFFDFHQVFSDHTMFKCFYEYLETEHNTEPLQFITKLNEIERLYYKMMQGVRELEQQFDNVNNQPTLTTTNLNLKHTPTTQSFSDIPRIVLDLEQKAKHKSKKIDIDPLALLNAKHESIHIQTASHSNLFKMMKQSVPTPSPENLTLNSNTINEKPTEEESSKIENNKQNNNDANRSSSESDSNVVNDNEDVNSEPTTPSTVPNNQFLSPVSPKTSANNFKLDLSEIKKVGDEKSPEQQHKRNTSRLSRIIGILGDKKKKYDEIRNFGLKAEEGAGSEGSSSLNASYNMSGTTNSSISLGYLTPRSKYDGIIKLYRKQISLAVSLMKDFVEEKAPKEINISYKDKKTFYDLFVGQGQYNNLTEWLLPQPPHLIFRTLKNAVIYELENDSFPRFVRSEIWIKRIQQKGLNFLKKVGVLKETRIFPYTDEQFKEFMVYDKDIDFMEYLGKDDYLWKLQGSKKEGAINVYKITEKNILPNVSFYQRMQINKWSGVLPFNFDIVKKCLMPGEYVSKYDPNITGCEELHYFDSETIRKKFPNEKFKYGNRAISVMRYGVEFPWPFKTKRSFLAAASAWYDKNQQKLTLIYKPCEHEKYYVDGKDVDKSLIDIRDFQYYQIKKLDSQRTSIMQIHLLDVGGNARMASNLLRLDRAKRMWKGFVEYLEKNQNNIPTISEQDPVWKLVCECMGKEQAEKIDVTGTLYNDLQEGRNIRNGLLHFWKSKLRKQQQSPFLENGSHMSSSLASSNSFISNSSDGIKEVMAEDILFDEVFDGTMESTFSEFDDDEDFNNTY